MDVAGSQLIAAAQAEALGRIGAGLLAGLFAAWAIATLLSWRRLQGTFALPLVAVGYVLLAEAGEALYGWALVVAGTLGCYLRYHWRYDDIKAGGELGRQAREARGIVDLLRFWRQRYEVSKRGRQVSHDRYALGTDTRGAIVRLPLALSQGVHMLFLGATGAGKTTSMLWALSRHLEAGCAGIVIDPKGDPELVKRVRGEAQRRGRPFYLFSLDSPEHHWNPLTWGSPSEQADKLIGAEEWTEPHYKRLYQRYLLNLFCAIDARDEIADLATTVELLDPDRLALYCRDIEDEHEGERLAGYLADLTVDERRDLSGLRNRLALMVEGEHGPMLQPADDDPPDEVDLLLAIRSGGVVVFSLNSSRFPETAKLLGAAVFQDLKAVAGLLETRPDYRRPAVVCVDEFAAFGSDHVLGVFQRARSAGISLLLATQEVADLRRIDPALQDQVLGNVETVIAHRQNVPESAELIAELAGTREVWLRTFQTVEGLKAQREGKRDGQLGSKRRGHEFIVAPDTVKRLPTGEAVVVRKNPHSVRQVRIFSELHGAPGYEGQLTPTRPVRNEPNE